MVSANGRFVTFHTRATNLVDNPFRRAFVFVHDLQTHRTIPVDIGLNGENGNGGSFYPCISGDGRFVGFSSSSTNLVPGIMGGKYRTYVRDLWNQSTEYVSVGMNGDEGNGSDLMAVQISASGTIVAFTSTSSNLVPNDTNGSLDVFVRDLGLKKTTRVNLGAFGKESRFPFGFAGGVSGNGRYVVFGESASDLVPGDLNGNFDAFVHDRTLVSTQRVSVNSNGQEAPLGSQAPHISTDGRFVVFSSDDPTLVAGDTNGVADVFVHDLSNRTTRRISVSSRGVQADGASGPNPRLN